MTPLVRCVVTTIDEDSAPVPSVKVSSWPNVGWWNNGSQIYCYPLVRGEQLLRERDYYKAKDDTFPAHSKAKPMPMANLHSNFRTVTRTYA